jgi:GH25 family lysozyme M1 (1,4-beta-N-acetylmuramidase)
MSRGIWLAAALLLSSVISGSNAVACDKGSDIDEEHCRFFFIRKPLGEENTNVEITRRMTAAGVNAEYTRSFAVLIGISRYPNLPEKDRELEPARRDLENMKSFLVEQSFDEIIVIKDADANRATIDYFLNEYLPPQLDARQNTARVLVAFSGHGTQGDPVKKIPGALALQGFNPSSPNKDIYSLAQLAPVLQNLASRSFQFLALLGSCYSGGLFAPTVYSGGNDVFPGAAGAHAISSTKDNDLAYGLSKSSGSIFFDQFIAAARDVWTDLEYGGELREYAGGARLPMGGGIVRLGMIFASMSSRIAKLGTNPATSTAYPQPMFGSVKLDGASQGALFFLVPKAKDLLVASDRLRLRGDIGKQLSSTAARQTVAFNLPAPTSSETTGSAVVGHPEIKVFNAPDTYAVYGLDVSHWEGSIDWRRVAENKRIKFAYMKATERRKDITFDYNWEQAKLNGLRRGAFHVFSFCRSAKQQFEVIKAFVPRTDDALPFALDVLWYGGPMQYESQCRDIPKIRSNLKELIKMCAEYFGKPVVLHTPAEFWAQFSEVVTPETIVWLQDWKSSPAKGAGPSNPGSAPWTLWQFSRSATVAGINSAADLNAFFGTEQQFQSFAAGKSSAYNAACRSNTTDCPK